MFIIVNDMNDQAHFKVSQNVSYIQMKSDLERLDCFKSTSRNSFSSVFCCSHCQSTCPNQTLPIDDALVCAPITCFVSKTQSHGSTGGGVGRMGTSSKQEKVFCTQVAPDNKTLYNSSGKRDRAEISGRAGT